MLSDTLLIWSKNHNQTAIILNSSPFAQFSQSVSQYSDFLTEDLNLGHIFSSFLQKQTNKPNFLKESIKTARHCTFYQTNRRKLLIFLRGGGLFSSWRKWLLFCHPGWDWSRSKWLFYVPIKVLRHWQFVQRFLKNHRWKRQFRTCLRNFTFWSFLQY